jgi:type II secretory pathway component PulK
MVLSSGRRGAAVVVSLAPSILLSRRIVNLHRNQFTQHNKHADGTQPDKQVSIDNTGRASILEALQEQHERTFPGDKNGTAEAQDGEETEAALWDGVLVMQVILALHEKSKRI